MKTIHKYGVRVRDALTLQLPDGAQILSVHVQNGEPQLWAIVDPNAPKRPRHFRVFGTGHKLPETVPLRYVGTFLLDGDRLVFHLFETPGE